MTQQTPPSSPRRNWLLTSLQAGVTVTLAAIFYPVVRFLRPRATTQSAAMQVVSPYRVNQLEGDAALAPFDFGGKPCLIVKSPDGKIRAFNALCTHVDCTVAYRAEHHDIFCNCHNGVYDTHGRNIAGPPPRPLEEYKVTLGSGKPGEEQIIVSRA